MKALLTWITPRRRPEDDVVLADEGLGGLWWVEVNVTLHPLAATRMRRGEAMELAGLSAGVSGTLTRTGLTRAKLKLWGKTPKTCLTSWCAWIWTQRSGSISTPA